jgi:hypothetical protein
MSHEVHIDLIRRTNLTLQKESIHLPGVEKLYLNVYDLGGVHQLQTQIPADTPREDHALLHFAVTGLGADLLAEALDLEWPVYCDGFLIDPITLAEAMDEARDEEQA